MSEPGVKVSNNKSQAVDDREEFVDKPNVRSFRMDNIFGIVKRINYLEENM